MKKLIKPGKPIEDYSSDRVEAFCEHLPPCGKNCYFVCGILSCFDVNATEAEEDILF